MRQVLTALIAAVRLVSASQNVFSIHDDIDAFPQYNIVFSPSPISSSDATDLLASSIQSHEADTSSIPLEYTRLVLHSTPHLCSIPRPPDEARNLTSEALYRASLAHEISSANTRGWELLAPLDNTCIYYMSGWWSYRFCYNDTVTQFHAATPQPGHSPFPPVRDPMTPKYVLGRAKPQTKRKPRNEDHGESSGEGGTDLDLVGSREGPNDYSGEEQGTLRSNGDTRYLVQRLRDGTICDLTLRPRDIEIQYHCATSGGDRIAWIKEVTACSYLMVVYTPRLCNDIVFQPPVATETHEIICKPIVGEAGSDSSSVDSVVQEPDNTGNLGATHEKATDAAKDLTEASKEKAKPEPLIIGGTVVGGGEYFPASSPPLLKPPPNWFSNSHAGGSAKAGAKDFVGSAKNVGAAKGSGSEDSAALADAVNARLDTDGEVLIEILAHGRGQSDRYHTMSDKELQKLGIKPSVVMGLADQLRRVAGERKWTLALVEAQGLEGGREIRGVVDAVDEDGKEDSKAAEENEWAWEMVEELVFGGEQDGKMKTWKESEQKAKVADTTKQKGEDGGDEQPKEDAPKKEEGSEETYYKDEL